MKQRCSKVPRTLSTFFVIASVRCRPYAVVSSVSPAPPFLSFVPSPTTMIRRNAWFSQSYRSDLHAPTTTLQQQQSSVDGGIHRMEVTNADTSDTPPTIIATPVVTSNFKYHHLTNVERIFCLSDLHTDHADNVQWLRNHPVPKLSSTDLLIVAGDISHQLTTFHETMSILRNQYQCQVLFVPGNHEAWLSSSSSLSSSANEESTIVTSFDKLQQIYGLCRTMGVYVDPVYIHCDHPVWILPLQSWYDGSLTFDETLCAGFDKWPWMDFVKCRWDPHRFVPSTTPPNPRIPQGLVEYFLQLNQENIIVPFQLLLQEQPILLAPCITVSHFAPNQQCLPDWKDLSMTQFQVDAWLDHGAATMSAKFAKVAGTKLLDDQIRTLLPSPRNEHSDSDSSASTQQQQYHHHHLIHIFGHSHRPKDFVFDQVRYIHNPLGKPRERQLHMISPNVTFQYLWDHHMGEIPGPTIIRYWEQFGGGKEMLWQRMSSSLSSSSTSTSSSSSKPQNSLNTTNTAVDIQGGRYRSPQ